MKLSNRGHCLFLRGQFRPKHMYNTLGPRTGSCLWTHFLCRARSLIVPKPSLRLQLGSSHLNDFLCLASCFLQRVSFRSPCKLENILYVLLIRRTFPNPSAIWIITFYQFLAIPCVVFVLDRTGIQALRRFRFISRRQLWATRRIHRIRRIRDGARRAALSPITRVGWMDVFGQAPTGRRGTLLTFGIFTVQIGGYRLQAPGCRICRDSGHLQRIPNILVAGSSRNMVRRVIRRCGTGRRRWDRMRMGW